jgi:uncharacterized protein (TIGR02145 family)
MNTNHQMNYYDYAKTLSAEGVMTALIGGGAGPKPEQHESVDLGLSVKWATCNIGANTPEEAGLYFAWGETQGYTAEQVGTDKNFSWEDYEFGPDTALTKYNETDGLTVLEPEDDAATANWGDGWRMPTKEEFEELMTLPHSWDASRSGYSFTDGNDNELLFVFAGGYAYYGVNDLGENGYYWSGSLYEDNDIYAWELGFSSDEYEIGDRSRYFGRTVRPVRSQNL